MRILPVLLLLLHATSSFAAPLAPQGAVAPDTAVHAASEQRRAYSPSGTGDHTSADSTPHTYLPVDPPATQAPTNSAPSSYEGKTQYGCLGVYPGNNWALSADGLGDRNFTGGSCTFKSSTLQYGTCSEGCGSYSYYPTKTVSMPGSGTSDGQEVVDRSSCSYPYHYTYSCNCSQAANGFITCGICDGVMCGLP